MHGHQVGDESLCALASWIKSQLRECDHLARYGGEEFVVLLPQCDEFMALQVAERIRANVEAQCLVTPSIQLKLTVSIGVCTFLMTDGSLLERDIIIKQLLKMADQAVYDAKKLGRNRVCVRTFDQYI
jgi:diguanylate cyclase (GGDEF)-like protein